MGSIKHEKKEGETTMVSKNPRLCYLASRVTQTLYHPRDRVAIWRGQFLGEPGVVIKSVGKKMHILLCAPPAKVRKKFLTVVVFKTSCILIE
jgi:hypothetical protein